MYFRTFPLFMTFQFPVLFTLNNHVRRAHCSGAGREVRQESASWGKLRSLPLPIVTYGTNEWDGLCGARRPGRVGGRGLGAEEAHGAHHVLAADGALGQLLGAGRAGGDVPALQQHALQRRRHADLAALFEGKVVHFCNGTQTAYVDKYCL